MLIDDELANIHEETEMLKQQKSLRDKIQQMISAGKIKNKDDSTKATRASEAGRAAALKWLDIHNEMCLNK